MIRFSELTEAELEWLAGSRWGNRKASEIPSDWREQLLAGLEDRGVIDRGGDQEEETTG